MIINGIEYVKKEEAQLIQDKNHPYTVGKTIVVRTVTMIQVGKLKAVGEKELVLENAAWIADTGMFADFCKNGPTSPSAEVEPFPDGEVFVGRGALVDALHVDWNAPRVRK
jgi:hypothetical protein